MKFKALIYSSVLFSSLAWASNDVTNVMGNCDTQKDPVAQSRMETLMQRGYKLISVVVVDNEPSPTPGYKPRACSYIFALQN